MDQKNDDQAPRYTPTTEQGALLGALLQDYDRAYQVAHSAQERLLAWVGEFVDVKVGDIVLQSRRHGATTGFVPTFEMRGTFTGWKGNTPRMQVQEIHFKTRGMLSHFPSLALILSGVPLKDDGSPFKSATCSVEIDLMQQAMDSLRDMPDGYRGFSQDVTTCYVDRKLSVPAAVAPQK